MVFFGIESWEPCTRCSSTGINQFTTGLSSFANWLHFCSYITSTKWLCECSRGPIQQQLIQYLGGHRIVRNQRKWCRIPGRFGIFSICRLWLRFNWIRIRFRDEWTYFGKSNNRCHCYSIAILYVCSRLNTQDHG